MLDQTRMNQFKEHGGTAALKWRDELVTALQSRISDTLESVNRYFEDKREKEAAISGRVEKLQEDLEQVQEEISSFGPGLAAATISGDDTALSDIQEKISRAENKRAAITTQIDLLSGAAVTGDKALFDQANEKAEALEGFWAGTQADLSALSVFASDQVSAWGKVANIAALGGNLLPRGSVASQVEKMRKDFRGVE